MFHRTKRKDLKVGVEQAKKLSTLNTYEGQRPMRPKHVRVLVEEMINGTFTVGHIAVAYCKWLEKWVLANGQHQCAAVLEAGKPIEAAVEEYECETPEDFARLYRTFDNNAVRSLSEIALPEARAQGLSWSRKFIGIMLAGISFLEGHSGVHKNKRVEFLKRYIKEGSAIYDIISPFTFPEYRHLARGPVIAAMIITFRKCSADAEVFWKDVRDGENLPGKSPALKLRNYLMSATVGVGRGVSSPSLSAAVSYREMYGKSIVAWNAFRNGDPTALKFFIDKPLPKAI